MTAVYSLWRLNLQLPTSAEPPAEKQAALWQPEWRSLAGPEAAADHALVAECVELYSNHYGRWGEAAENPGEPVRISTDHFLALLDDDNAWLACASKGEMLIGYCIAVRADIPSTGAVAWVSQLVVHETYRDSRVATGLLYSVWQFSDCYAWGLVTANPFAIRALETATRRQCRSRLITIQGPEILKHIRWHVPYIPEELVKDDDQRPQPRVDTKFLLDHSEIPRMRERAARGDRPWDLGSLGEGEEWLGCTFSAQKPQDVDDERLGELLTGADSIWLQAYESMTLDEDHAWRRHSASEVDLALELTGIRSGAAVLDVGCGDGRHLEPLIKRGFQVCGVDISPRLIARAREATLPGSGAYLAVGDARQELPAGPFGLVLCLYDVFGSSARAEDDQHIIHHIARVLADGGYLIASVMNDGVMADKLAPERMPSTNTEFISALEQLPPSTKMEKTGNVFDPGLLLSYDGVYYRKEQFQQKGRQLPAELVVRDRRFNSADVRSLVETADLEVIEIRPVQSGRWDRKPVLAEDDPAAKELLFIARKPR